MPCLYSMMMLKITKKQLMVLFLLEMSAQQAGHLIHQLQDLLVSQAGNQGLEQILLVEQTEKDRQRPFIGLSVQAKTDLPEITFHSLLL